MPKSALSPRLLDADNWKGTDDDVWYLRWRIKLKYLFAYGPRATEWWAKWREYPKTLFAIRSKQGVFRVEAETWERDSAWEGQFVDTKIVNQDMWLSRPHDQFVETFEQGYLSRVQYYTRWSFQVQWPFMVAAHFYMRAADVPEYGKPRPDTDGKLWFFYIGTHRDADKVYWFPSAYIGSNWK